MEDKNRVRKNNLDVELIFLSFSLSRMTVYSAGQKQPFIAINELQRQCIENSKQIFPEMKLLSLVPNSCICERFVYSHNLGNIEIAH